MTALISSGEYPEIRALVDTGLTSEELPDATIAMDWCAGHAARLVKGYVATAESLTGDSFLKAQMAACLVAASMLARSAPRWKALRLGALSEDRQEVDWQRHSRRLLMQADELIRELM